MLMDLAWRDTELGGKVKIVANGQGVDGAWLGGSMVSSCERLQEALIMQELYDEHGPYPLCFFISVFCSRTHLLPNHCDGRWLLLGPSIATRLANTDLCWLTTH